MAELLQGIRVCDLTRYWAGPWCTTALADLGAEVIKVEDPNRIDIHRVRGPFADGQTGWDRCGTFIARNRNKLSWGVDLHTPEGIAAVKDLVKVSDIVAENFVPGHMDKLGLSYQALRAVRPDVILISVSGWGATGPHRLSAGTGDLVGTYAGLAISTGLPESDPHFLGVPMADPMAGLFAAFAGMAALQQRRESGQGRHIDVSMLEAMLSFLPHGILEHTLNHRQAPKTGNRDRVWAPQGCYPCKGDDAWVAIAVTNDQEWQGLCRAMGSPAWAKDERFADPVRRWENQEELDRLIGQWTLQSCHHEVTEVLQRQGVPAAPAMRTDELVGSEHLRARQFWAERDMPEVGRRVLPGYGWNLGAGSSDMQPGPRFAEHDEYVVTQLLGLLDFHPVSRPTAKAAAAQEA
ncbi:MAG: CoA transferase [Chloroflexi bacterium]|nr:CoA transferase [Chloroflexota bacterium]